MTTSTARSGSPPSRRHNSPKTRRITISATLLPALPYPKVCRSPKSPAGSATSRSPRPWTCTGTWSRRPAAVLAMLWTRRSPDCACAPYVPPSVPDYCCDAGQRHRRRASRPVGRVLCARVSGPAAIHLGLPLPAASCGLPASIGRAARSRRPRAPKKRAALVTLLRVGFTKPPGSLRALVVSYTTVSPLPWPGRSRAGAVCFLWHFPAGHPGSVLPTTLPCGARTFLAGAMAPARPPGRLARRNSKDRRSWRSGADHGGTSAITSRGARRVQWASRAGDRVHGLVGEQVGVGVALPWHPGVGDPAERARRLAGLRGE